ncbi:Cdc2-related kinase, arginine/serine-rich [Talaromyces islandicus]|uniref:Cdc2-related kinase, arginine/serine-rich n=1 Tax=Talaromyces islandicus TaxID=28573 RepID=A0A0U1LVN1_TALIS|nr:Cdc2-related kinase, arginine/serine-rich [Talaromyces islandicus]
MADTRKSREDLAASDSPSSTPRQKRSYHRWSDEEKQRLLSRREEYPDLSWKAFQEKFYPGGNPTSLQKTHSEFKRNSKQKSEMSATIQMKQSTLLQTPNSTTSKRKHDADNESDSNSSGDDIPYLRQAKKPQTLDRPVSRDPRKRPAKPSDQRNKAPQIENSTPAIERTARAERLSTDLQPSTVSVTSTTQGIRENTDTGTVEASNSPRRSQSVEGNVDYVEIYVLSRILQPEIRQTVSQLVEQVSTLSEESSGQREKLSSKMSQMEQNLTSKSDQLRVSEEKKQNLEAENLQLKTKIESLQSENSELRNKCDQLEQMKLDVGKRMGFQGIAKMTAANPEAFFASTTNSVIIPNADTDIHEHIARWSDERLKTPALIVIPSSQDDIVVAIDYAREHGLTLVTGSGGHKVVPIDEKTLYLDIRNFKEIRVDKDSDTTEIGGAVTNFELMTALLQDGYYTTYANSGAVSMAGLILGGGFGGGFSSIHGLPIDNVLAFEGVTASGEIVRVDKSASDPDKKELFEVLCGAGYGLLVITSLSMKIHKLSSLNLEDGDKLWVRKFTFPAIHIEKAVDFFQKLLPVKPKLIPFLLCGRAPPTAPVPGAPMIILTITYYGPESEGRGFIDPLVTSSGIDKLSVASETTLAPFGTLFYASKMLDAHGGFKTQHIVRAKSFSASSILSAFERWKRLGDEVMDARPMSLLVVWGYNPAVTVGNSSASDKRPFIGRDRPMFGNAITWYNKPESTVAVEDYAAEVTEILRQDDAKNGISGASLPNNFRNNSQLYLGYTDEMLAQINRVHAKWNPDSIFYNVLQDSGV